LINTSVNEPVLREGSRRNIRTFCNDQNLVEERRRQLIDCAIQLFVKNGYEPTTMGDIARACGWSKGLMYHYMSTKDDILYLIAQDQAEGTIASFSTLRDKCQRLSPTKALVSYINYYYGIVHRSQDYQVFLNQVAARLPREDRKILFDADRFALDVLDSILKRGVESGDFEMEDTTLMAHNILLIGRVWADRRWFLQKRYNLDDYIRIQTGTILKAISKINSTGAGISTKLEHHGKTLAMLSKNKEHPRNLLHH